MNVHKLLTRLFPVILGLVLLATGAAALFWLSQSTLFTIDSIEIEGNRVVPDEQVLEVAEALKGKSLFTRSLADVETSLEQLPFVENAEIERDFPGSVLVRLREYRPLASYKNGNNCSLLAGDAKVLAQSEQPQVGYPVLATKEPCQLQVGETAGCPELTTGLSFLNDVPVSFNQEFVEVTISGVDVSAKTKANLNIHFGTLDQYALKFEVLRQLIARTGTGAGSIIDVSVPDRPVTR